MNEMKSMTKVIAPAYAPFRYNVASRTDSIMFYKQDFTKLDLTCSMLVIIFNYCGMFTYNFI
jgi:hypothetical protein